MALHLEWLTEFCQTVGAFCFGDEPSGYPSADPEEILSSEGSEDAEPSPPCGASLWSGVEEEPIAPLYKQ